jgi:hypothetical protein
MFAFYPGAKPVFQCCALAALLGLSGCSSAGTTQYSAENTQVAPARIAQAATEVEDDGLPSQSPPPVRIHQMPDDPNEPFSRNYGGGNPAAVPAEAHDTPTITPPVAKPIMPADLPPAFRQKLVTALSQDE